MRRSTDTTANTQAATDTLYSLMVHLLGNKDDLLAGLDEVWVSEYDWLQKRLPTHNVAEDHEYRLGFKGFYFKDAGVNDRYQDSYFKILEREKGNPSVSFKETLNELPELPIDTPSPSYTSKLVATVNPNRPVWNSNVSECLRNHGLGMKRNSHVEDYRRLVETTGALVENPAFATLRTSFDDTFSCFADFTDMKKLDFYLWQCGRERREDHKRRRAQLRRR